MERLRGRRWALILVGLLALLVVGCYGGTDTALPTGTATARAVEPMASNGLPTISVGQLPEQGRETLRLIHAGGPFPYSRDGIVYHNNSGALPAHADGWYHEYTVVTPGVQGRGPRRIVCGSDSTCYWTPDHYSTFYRIVE